MGGAGVGSLLAVDGIGKRYGGRWIFRSISFELGQGDSLLVLGANGSGKSTLLKVISGLIPSSEGSVALDVGDPRVGMGVTTLDLAVYPNLTVKEHLELAGTLRGVESRADELLEYIGLPHAADLLASQLSTGMRSRLKIALAIQPWPLVLLLDEPGAALDAKGRQLIDKVVAEQKTRGAVLIATNDPEERRLGTLELDLGG